MNSPLVSGPAPGIQIRVLLQSRYEGLILNFIWIAFVKVGRLWACREEDVNPFSTGNVTLKGVKQ